MTNLTLTQKKLYNNLSNALDEDLSLGTLLGSMISALPTQGTPVNAVAATEVLTISGVVVDGETITIDNPEVAGSDTYEFLTDAAQTKTTSTNIAVDISSSSVKASGSLTMDTQPTSGDTVTIGENTYVFVPVGTANAEGEVSIGANLAGAQANLVAAINGSDGVNTPHSDVSLLAFSNNVATVRAFIGGSAGNSIVTTETFTAGTNIFASGTLGSGSDCSAANAITALVSAISAHDSQGVGAVDGTGDTIDLTADVKGASGNSISISATLAHGSFTDDATHLSGGVDGTVSEGISFMVDDTYLYVTLGGNTVSDANWRRISLGSSF